MDVSIVLTLVQTLVQLMDSPARREIEFMWGYKSQLDSLSATMATIRSVLLDLEKQERQQLELSHMLQNKLERLKEVLYQADDLFDKVTTLTLRKRLMSGNSMSKEVQIFFSRFNQLHSAYRMSREIRKIRVILNDIAKDHLDFASRHQNDLEVNKVVNDRETHSFVHEEDVIIGRDGDKRILIDMLLNNYSMEDVSFVTIVGMGGLGKTTLAQLVYNDERVEREFPLKMWICVANDFHTKVLRKLLTSVTNQTDHDGLQMDQLQRKLRQELEGKKYLLVLDDVWNEDFNKWRKLKILLMGGARGSRVIVTTRSKRVAEVVGNLYMYELHGLSDDDSWNLFKRMTLEAGQHQMKPYMVEIGKDIVRKCANVPLALRVVGSLLRGQDEGRWRYLKNTDLANLKHVENDIVGTLKISYYYLPFHLKSCFSFCAIFPKHYKIKKDGLIRLWMAHGLIMPLDGESFEDAGEEYFMILLQRCFFQEVERAENGEVLSCRMHDLIHDLAIELAGSEVLLLNNNTRCFDKNIRHLFINNNVTRIDFGEHLTEMKKLRTVIRVGYYPTPLTSLDMLLLKARFLRVLDLRRTSFEKLPSKISRLLHLRYLDLSWNHKLSLLPDGITELYNLQTLMLRGCRSLAELPRDLKKLIQLRCLDIYDCSSMTHMPPGMNKMTCLRNLTMFLVGKTSNSRSLVPVNAGGLGDLKHLNNLTGTLEIRILGELEDEVVEAKREGNLINKQNLRGLIVGWERKLLGSNSKEKDSEGSDAERILYGMQPHPNLRIFRLWDYPGVRFPCWGSLSMNLGICLPNLVEVEINGGKVLEHLPLFSRLHYLKSLELTRLRKLEYVERIASKEDDLVFFQSLEKLVLGHLQELKGWREESGLEDQKKEVLTVGRLAFPRLSHLHIWECWNLRSLPLCPNLEKLELNRFNPALCPIASPRNERTSFSGCNSTSNAQLQVSEGMKEVKIDKVGYLNSLPLESFKCLSSVVIRGDHEIERLATGEAGKVFQSGRFSSLQSLVISDCSKLKSLSGRRVWEHLTALESLQLKLLSELNLDDDDDSDNTDISWRYLNRNLRSMLLWYLPKLVKLPKGMQQLTSLETLQITNCDNFEILPSWISCFTSLQFLVVRNCGRLKSLPQEMSQLLSLQHLDIRGCSSELSERCLETTGADWPKIQHIPRIDVLN